MSNIQKAIDTIQGIQDCYLYPESDMECLCCEHSIAVMEASSACNAAIAALQEKQHNDELRKRLRTIYGDEVSAEQILEEFIQHIEDPNKPLKNTQILTYEDAEKWEKWKQLKKQGRLVELPCAIGKYVYRIVKTGASEIYTIIHEGHEYSREVPFWGIWPCEFNLKLMDEFGKTVFLTYEAAQEVLKKMEKAAGMS